MHVIILADFAIPNGGAAKVAMDSAEALTAAGCEVTYIHAVGTTGEIEGPCAYSRVGLGLPDIWNVKLPRAAAVGIWNREAARRLGTVLDGLETASSVLHLHQWSRSFSPSLFPVVARTHRPLAVTLHDYFFACPNGLYYRFDREEPCTLTPLSPACVMAPCDPRSSLHKAIRAVRTAVTRRVTRGQRLHLVHVSDRGRDTLAPFLDPEFGQHRVDNPVDVRRGPPASIGKDARVAYVGRLTREKGADLVARAAALAGQPVMFIGTGPLEAELRAMAPDAEFLGWRSGAEIDQILRSRVRAVVAPSRWYETGPLTIYESLAAGVPAVASSRSGAAEKVADGQTGFVVAPEPEPLAQALRQLADLDVARRMGQAAYERYWVAPFSREAHARRLIEVYGAMLQHGGEAAPASHVA